MKNSVYVRWQKKEISDLEESTEIIQSEEVKERRQ